MIADGKESSGVDVKAFTPDYCKECLADQLYFVINSANPANLEACLENPHLTDAHVIGLLRNSFITQEIVRKISANRQWIMKYNIKAALVHCSKTPYNLSIEYVYFLFWRDLLNVAKDLRIDPRIRVSAERLIIEKMEELSVGERISLSRMATPAIIKILIREKEHKVISELLVNPKIIEDDVVRIINATRDISILADIAKNQKWSFRYNVKKALISNSMTPLTVAINLLKTLLKRDLLAISKHPGLSSLLRKEAEQILKQKTS
jgi:hypothetical protein